MYEDQYDGDGCCCHCGKSISLPYNEDFCSSQCKREWKELARENAEYDQMVWGISGPPDTPCVDY